MNAPATDTNQLCADLGIQVQQTIRRRIGTVAGVCLIAVLVAGVYGLPHTGALAWIIGGSLVPIMAWSKLRHPGLPLVCLISLQTIAIFATPIISQNPSLENYPASDLFWAGFEVCVFSLAIALGWRLAFGLDLPATPPRHYHGLSFIDPTKPRTLCRASLILLGLGTAFQFTQATGVVDLANGILPAGVFPVVRTFFEAAALAGALIGAYASGNDMMLRGEKRGFWALLVFYFLLRAASILLSTVAGIVTAATVGYFLGAKRPPWLFLTLTILGLSFLNLSKFEMRAKYWNEYGYLERIPPVELPGFFGEWALYSLNIITFNRNITAEEEAVGQRLTDRLDNLQNLLFVQSAITHRDHPPLLGETYALIPQLFIPRFLWPDKPIAHEGQVMLNVHFGRQRKEDTVRTFVAWGLLAEAYGNFGSVWGPLFCGLFLGAGIGGMERLIRPYPVASLQAFFFLIIAVNFSLSFEMVAGVWITSVFQMIVALLVSVIPFSRACRLPPAAPS